MRSIESWLSEYAQSHQHPTNIAIHKVAVPLIMLSVLGLAWSLSVAFCVALTIAAVVFYFTLSNSLGIGMALFSMLELSMVYWIDRRVGIPLWLVSLAIFVIAWIFQFIGHRIEGKRPSFLKDLVFLFIGPAWVIVPVYRALDIKL